MIIPHQTQGSVIGKEFEPKQLGHDLNISLIPSPLRQAENLCKAARELLVIDGMGTNIGILDTNKLQFQTHLAYRPFCIIHNALLSRP